MRLVNRDEMLTMPIGTVYQEYAPDSLGPLLIKAENCPEGDWFKSAVAASKLLGEDFVELSCCKGREGYAGGPELFVVHSNHDVKYMVARLIGVVNLPVRTLTVPRR